MSHLAAPFAWLTSFMPTKAYARASTVRIHRVAQGLRQADLAAAAGVSRDTIRRVEAGARPWPTTAKAIAAALGCEPGELFENGEE